MNRDNFNRKYGNPIADAAEMDRKWRVYIREQEDMKAMHEAYVASQRSATSTAGGCSYGDNSVNNYVVYDYVENYFE